MRQRVTPSLILSVLALVLATAGGATASALITGAQIKNASLTGSDVKNGSLTAADFNRKALRRLRGPRGVAGAPGAPGAVVATVEAVSDTATLNPSATGQNERTVKAECPAGTVVTGGGWDGDERILISYAKMEGNGFTVTGTNITSATVGLQAQAICARIPGARR